MNSNFIVIFLSSKKESSCQLDKQKNLNIPCPAKRDKRRFYNQFASLKKKQIILLIQLEHIKSYFNVNKAIQT